MTGRRDEPDADLERQHHERHVDRAEPGADRGADHVAVDRERERVVGAVGQLPARSSSRVQTWQRAGPGRQSPSPNQTPLDRPPVGLVVEVDVAERHAVLGRAAGASTSAGCGHLGEPHVEEAVLDVVRDAEHAVHAQRELAVDAQVGGDL